MNVGNNVVHKIVGRGGCYFRHGRGRVWHWVSSDLRECIIDAEVMDVVRGANTADNQKPHTPEELLEFRARLATALAVVGFAVDS